MQGREIEIKRNVIEKFLMVVKDYVRNHKKLILYILLTVLLIVVLIVAGFIFYEKEEKSELSQFEKILFKYATESKGDEKNLQSAVDSLNQIINSSYWGYVNENGYYIIAGLYLNHKKYQEAKNYLLKYVDHSPSSFFAPLALQRAAVACEQMNDINGAFQIYQQLEREYESSLIADEIYYDLGRMFQHKGESLKAKEYYNKLLSSYPSSMFVSKAKKRLLLLSNNSGKKG